jgi:hypothetical protein
MIYLVLHFIIGAFMDKEILLVIIAQIVALLIVGLNFLFNYLSKNKEFKHNEHLKKLELEQREKERKFKIEEKMIERSLEAHMEAFSQLVKIFDLVNEYYTGKGTLDMPTAKSEELFKLIAALDEWRSSKGFFLEKTIHKQIGLVAHLVTLSLKPSTISHPSLDPWHQSYRTIKGLLSALDNIFKQYNPLYDLNIKLPEIGIS